MPIKVAYLEQMKEYTEKIIEKYVQDKPLHLISCQNLLELACSLKEKKADEGIIPVESFYGSEISSTIDMVVVNNIKIKRSITIMMETRAKDYLVLGLEEAQPHADGKTAVILYLKDNPGALFDILREFAYANINLTKIESRISKERFGEYLFFIEFLGRQDEENITKVLKSIKEKSNNLFILGSYPYEQGEEGNFINGSTYLTSIPEIRKDIDIIDRQIIELLSKRVELVGMLSELKGSVNNVKDHQREKEVVARIREIAADKDVDANFIERLYQIIIDHCVDLQVLSLKK